MSNPRREARAWVISKFGEDGPDLFPELVVLVEEHISKGQVPGFTYPDSPPKTLLERLREPHLKI
jgi:hypothetical protein